jgi:hypothetical protein
MMLIGRRMFNLPESDIDVANDVPFWHVSAALATGQPVRYWDSAAFLQCPEYLSRSVPRSK